jgi:hypothetical protein
LVRKGIVMKLDNQALLSAVGVGTALMGILGVLAGIPQCGLLCCIAPFGYIGTGAAYSFFGIRNHQPPTPQDAAIGGGIAAGFAGAVFSIVWSISYSMFTTPQTVEAAMRQLEGVGMNTTSEMAQVAAQGPTLITMLACTMIAVANGAIFGALGGALVASRARPDVNVRAM